MQSLNATQLSLDRQGGSPVSVDNPGCIDEVGAERTESGALAATEFMAHEPSTPTLETLDSIVFLLAAPGRHLAGARRRCVGLRKSNAMAVPAFAKPKENNALGKWPR